MPPGNFSRKSPADEVQSGHSYSRDSLPRRIPAPKNRRIKEFPMRWMRCALIGWLALGLAYATSNAQPTVSKEKLIGAWQVTKSAGDLAVGATLEFGKDGKLKVTAKVGGKEISTEAIYTLDGDNLTTVGPKGDRETLRIKKLTDTELVTEAGKGNGVVVGYEYRSDAKMKSVRPAKALPGGQSTFDLVVENQTFKLEAGKPFWINKEFPDGVAAFTIRGINPSEKLDPTDRLAFPTGISWMDGLGQHKLEMNPLVRRSQTEYKRK
jgi:uncharacterized protein (TIGR03066 family)